MTVALDLFAGTGWGVACQRLGIDERGVELMPEAVATREANGMHTIYRDVWDGLADPFAPIEYDLLIASPPCQTFSMAGNGAGRRALNDVLAVIDEGLWKVPHSLRALQERFDPRTALVLTPLAHVERDRPETVVLEQVPQVLPVWEAMAAVMRTMGYSVWTGVLNAEQYGVPQTRRRAILIGRLLGEAKPPTPTHSRYHSRDPKRIDDGVLPWVSMAQALGWGRTARPSVTVTGGGTETGGAEPLGHLAREVAAPDWIMRSNYGTGGDPAARGERKADQSAATVTSKANRNMWVHERPARTLSKNPVIPSPGQSQHNAEREQATGIPMDGWTQPTAEEKRTGRGSAMSSVRVTVAEAAALQTYPAGFAFSGSRSKQYLQVGNAVPPLLAEAILRAALA